jgi:hypothetical protein
VYFTAADALGRRPALRIPIAAVAVLLVATQWSISNHHTSMRWFSEGKARWRACYLARHDEAACDTAANFRIYPVEHAPQVEAMLQYLSDHRYNLYKTP